MVSKEELIEKNLEQTLEQTCTTSCTVTITGEANCRNVNLSCSKKGTDGIHAEVSGGEIYACAGIIPVVSITATFTLKKGGSVVDTKSMTDSNFTLPGDCGWHKLRDIFTTLFADFTGLSPGDYTVDCKVTIK